MELLDWNNRGRVPTMERDRPWVVLGQKKNQATVNTVRNNMAHSFDFKADKFVRAENNHKISESEFKEKLAGLAKLINAKFGETHPTAKRPRFEAPAR